MAWPDTLDARDMTTIAHAIDYADKYSEAGVVGHNQHLLIAKLARIVADLTNSSMVPATSPVVVHAQRNREVGTQQPWTGDASQLQGVATEKQRHAIYTIGRQNKRWTESQTQDECVRLFGIMPDELTKAEASKFIDFLKGTLAEDEIEGRPTDIPF